MPQDPEPILRILTSGGLVLAESAVGKVIVLEEQAREQSLLIQLPVRFDRATLHHAGFIRMFNEPFRHATQDWRQGEPSPLVAPFHIEMALGEAPFGLYPPIVVFGPDATFLVGPLTQEHARIHWNWNETGSGNLQLELQFNGGAILGSETIHVQSWEGSLPLEPDLFAGYNRALKARGLGRPTKQGLTWATWNDGIFRDISAERILAVTDSLSAHFPTVKWVQIDDGWAGPSLSVPDSNGDLGMSDFGIFYDLQNSDEDPRFPQGPGHLAAEIKARGLRPMLWLTPSVDERSKLFRDHPEWFQPDLRLHFVPTMRFFDCSVPEARAYIEKSLDTVFGHWGFEGCKLDFWSMGFEQPDAITRDGKKTGVEWERWFLDQIRRRLPEDGLFLHCIDLPFGTPFRSRWFDHFRLYADSEGICANPAMMREQAIWTAYLVALYGVQQFWIPNGDGFGTFSHIDMKPNNHRRWAAFLLGSGTITELAGWLYADPQASSKTEALRRVQEVAALAYLGAPVELPGYSFDAVPAEPPEIWSRLGPHPLIAITNWAEDAALSYQIPKAGLVGLFTGIEFQPGAMLMIPPGDGEVLLTIEQYEILQRSLQNAEAPK